MSTPSKPIDRRRFLATSSSTAAGLVTTAPHILRAQGQVSANEKLNVGIIGSSGQGAFSIGQLREVANIAALCDVDENEDARAADDKVQLAGIVQKRRSGG